MMCSSSFTTDWSDDDAGPRAATFGPSQLIQASAMRMAWPSADHRNDMPLSNHSGSDISRQKTYAVPKQSPRLLDIFSKVIQEMN